ncbi:MAG: hypothetical protein GY906_10275 [bacterium]|nr:hypothetical protein [bacterium]
MPRKQFPFGDLDGEKVNSAVAKLTGERIVDRKYEDGERILAVVEISVGGPPGFKRVDGNLIRVEKFAVSALVIIEDQAVLLRKLEKALDEAAEARTGAAKLPLDEHSE